MGFTTERVLWRAHGEGGPPLAPAAGPSPAPPARAADAPRFTGRVLATLNEDGSRRWLDPKLSTGRFYRQRRALAWFLIALFALLPFARIGGKPAILLDIVERRFTLFGTTFFATDTIFLMLLLVGTVISIFLLTALFGRVWCGWGCPQTVYMEFVFRPLERLFQDHPGAARRRLSPVRRAARAVAFVAFSFLVGNVFLSYFVGTDALLRWVTRPPSEHPIGFAIVVVTTALMLLDFGLFREQVCLVACPYGRLQSVLLDRDSLIVAYDRARGEPRGKLKGKGAPPAGAPRGDCIDCGACVATCPTGIDIRDGLQMECIHCTQCIDACDAIMDRVGKPRGLVRYSSQDQLAGKAKHFVRPRTAVYPAILAGIVALFAWTLHARTPLEVTVLRGIGAPFERLGAEDISNRLRVKVRNRTDEPRRYAISVALESGDTRAEGLRLMTPENPLAVPAGKVVEATVFVVLPRGAFRASERAIVVRVEEAAAAGAAAPEGAAPPPAVERPYRLLGPAEGASGGKP
jgi:cytochrome c oxidase accessory protein FixG